MGHSPSGRPPRYHRTYSQENEPLTYRRSFSRENLSTSYTMTNPNDVTIDIPLTKVSTSKSTGARKGNALSPQITSSDDYSGEKRPMYHKRGDSIMGLRRRKIEDSGTTKRDTKDGTLNAMGRFYDMVFHFSVITRYMLYVAPLALAIAVPIIIGAIIAQDAQIGSVRIVWFFTWVEVVWLSLWVAKLFAKFLPYLFQFVVGVVSSGTRKYSLVLTALEIPLSLVGWSVCALTTFVPLMTLNPEKRASGDTGLKPWMTIVKNILFACLFSSLVLLGEKLLVQLISISYHRKQFDDKIQDSKRNIYLTGLLFDASRALFPLYCNEFAEYDYVINDVLDIGALSSRPKTGRHSRRSGTQTPMRLIQNIGRVGDKVTAAFGNVAHEITGKQVFNPTSAHSIIVQALEKKRTSEALAKRIWLSFVLEGRDALYLDDIVDVLGEDRHAEAEEAFYALDLDGNGDISMDEMILRVEQFGRERASIANSMHDVDQAINVLDNLLCTVVFILVIFIFVAWLNTNFTTTLATTGTALLSLSFVFAATAQEVLGSCIFLFVKHPYDVGDRVDVGDKQYIVERISLLYTVFRCVTNSKRTQVPNIVLNTNWIDNVSRSKAMREQISIFISFDTTFEDIELLRKEMTTFVTDKDNARDFSSDVNIELIGIAEMNKMELRVEVRHKSNWSNEQVRAARRNKFMCALVLALRKVPIYAPGGGSAAAGDKANPTYSVAISHEEAEHNKDVYGKDKEAARLVPTKTTEKDDAAAASSGVDYWGRDVEPRNGEQASSNPMASGGLKQRGGGLTSPLSGYPTRQDELALDQQRSNDVELVKNILRRESTTGRRRISQHDALAPTTSGAVQVQLSQPQPAVTNMGYPLRHTTVQIPTPSLEVPEPEEFLPPPPIPPQAPNRPNSRSNSFKNEPQTQTQQPLSRVSYFEDGTTIYSPQPPPPAPVAATTSPLAQQYPTSRLRSGSTSANTSPQTYYPPGNAFAQQANQANQANQSLPGNRSRTSSGGSPPATRKPVPGMGGMKDYLQLGTGSGSIGGQGSGSGNGNAGGNGPKMI